MLKVFFLFKGVRDRFSAYGYVQWLFKVRKMNGSFWLIIAVLLLWEMRLKLLVIHKTERPAQRDECN